MLATRAVLATTLAALVLAGCAAERSAETGEIEEAGSVDAFTLRVGDCFDDQIFDTGEVEDVPGVPCSEPHDNEIYAAFDISGTSYPGDEAVGEQADAGCLERFQTAIGAPYEESVLEIFNLTPTQGSWEGRGDREVLCAAYHMEQEKLTGSVLGSGM